MRTSLGGVLRSVLFVSGALTLLGGCSPTFPVEADLRANAAHFEVRPSSKAFVPEWKIDAGPYEVRVQQTSTEREDGVPDRMRTTRRTESKLKIFRHGSEVATVECLDTFAWVQLEDTMFANDVQDEFTCRGQAGDEPFELKLTPEKVGYSGFLTAGGERSTLSSVHGRAAGIETLSLGYSLGEAGSVRASLQDPSNGKPGELWLKEGEMSDAEVAAVLALVVFREGE